MKHQLESMKECLTNCVQSQMSNLHCVDTKELGEAIDMLKDLEEAIYYNTITEAMKGEKSTKHYPYIDRDMDREWGRMYYDGGMKDGIHDPSSSGHPSHDRRMYTEKEISMVIRDPREGRSSMSRKSYMESREMHKDKSHQLKELEKYMQELTQDMVEMIEDASPEEKQYLEKRINALATKIGQLNG